LRHERLAHDAATAALRSRPAIRGCVHEDVPYRTNFRGRWSWARVRHLAGIQWRALVRRESTPIA